MQDISEYYDLERAKFEESEWSKLKYYERNYEQIDKLIKYINLTTNFDISNIIEFGCGSGWMPTLMPESYNYVGVDKNPFFLEWAREKNIPTRNFIKSDIRLFETNQMYDLSYSFAFVKHFSLREVPLILGKILSSGKYSAIEINIAPVAFDDGKEYHHTFVSEEQVLQVLEENEHKLMYKEKTFEGSTEEGQKFEVFTFMTRRI